MTTRKIRVVILLSVVSLSLTTACGDEGEGEVYTLGDGSSSGGSGKAGGEPGAAAPPPERAELPPAVYTDDDFAELDIQNRDPFRSYARAFKAQAAAPAQRRVLLPSTSLDEMRLIAIITGIATPRAMLTDTAQVGHVVRRGDYIGRPEVVQTGGSEGMPVTLNWRVDRIRPGSVVLTREDPTSPDKPPLTRVMPLNEGGEPIQLTTP